MLDAMPASTPLVTVLGFAAGTLTTFSFIPQVHKAWRTRHCDDLSLGMLLAFGTGVLLWLIYGLLLHAAPIIAANAVTLTLIAVLLYMKANFRGAT
jgi:MtN3 and saliva related transmembrane protein